MKQIKCTEPQPTVKVRQYDGKDYIYICVNPCVSEEDGDTIYIYDYSEIIEDTGVIDLDDVRSCPEKYLDYDPVKLSRLDRIEALIMTLLG